MCESDREESRRNLSLRLSLKRKHANDAHTLPFSFLTTSLSHSLSRQISVQLYFSLSLLRSFLFCHHWYSGQSVSPSLTSPLTSPLTSRVLKTEWVRESFEWFVVVVVASMPLSSSECFAGDLNAQRAKAWAPSLCSSRFYFLHSRGSSFEETKHFTLSLSLSLSRGLIFGHSFTGSLSLAVLTFLVFSRKTKDELVRERGGGKERVSNKKRI